MSGDTLTATDMANIVLETANSICNNMILSIDKSIYPLLDKIIFIDNSILKDSYYEKILGSSSSGILLLANCLLLAFSLYYCVRLLLSKFNGNPIESPFKFIAQIIIVAFLMNYAKDICLFIINATNEITAFFMGLGAQLFNKEISFNFLTSTLSKSNNFNLFSMDGILTGTLSVSAFALLMSFALRYILIKLLLLLSPFAFLCLTNRSTEPFFKSWSKSLTSLLILQIIIAIILLFIYALLQESSSTLFNKVLLIGTISALLKSGQLVKEFMGGIGISSNFQAGVSGIKSMISR